MVEKSYYTDFSCYGYNEESNNYQEYVSDAEYIEIARERERELEKVLVTN